jgi:two-component system CheB/CheR fusion protein
VLIQHLDPTHKSMLVDLLARDTEMNVLQAGNGMSVERNRLYVIPPQADLSIHDGVFRLSQHTAVRSGARLPFDFFLHSLADEYAERAVCVILSGTGADGSVGIRSVSEKGGLVIAQEPRETTYPGMPQSAIATGAVNLVLPAAKIPGALFRHAQRPYLAAESRTAPRDDLTDKSLTTIIDLLRPRASPDFAHYKRTTLVRRIRRRMAAAGAKGVDDYIKTLRTEVSSLNCSQRNC